MPRLYRHWTKAGGCRVKQHRRSLFVEECCHSGHRIQIPATKATNPLLTDGGRQSRSLRKRLAYRERESSHHGGMAAPPCDGWRPGIATAQIWSRADDSCCARVKRTRRRWLHRRVVRWLRRQTWVRVRQQRRMRPLGWVAAFTRGRSGEASGGGGRRKERRNKVRVFFCPGPIRIQGLTLKFGPILTFFNIFL